MTEPPAARTRPRRGYFLPGLIALTVLLAIGVAAGAGDLEHRPPPSLLGTDVAQELSVGIQAQQGGAEPTVTCPAREPVRRGLAFTCRTGGPHGRVVQVTEVDGRGHLRWSLGPPAT